MGESRCRFARLSTCVVFLLALTASAAAPADVMPLWRAIGDDASANACIVRGKGQPPVRYGDLVRKGSVELPVDGPGFSVWWNFRLPCDLSRAKGVSFDIRCDDASGFQGAQFYFKSGDGWYSQALPLEDEGRWVRVRILKDDCGTEGKPGGWDRIECLRINLFRTSARRTTTLAVADFSIIGAGAPPRVAVLRGDWASRRKGAESKAILNLAAIMSRALDAIGAGNTVIPDDELTVDRLKGVKLLVLPYNPALPDGAADALTRYVAGGGRLFVCYSLPKPVGGLLGVRSAGWCRPSDKGQSIAGLLRRGDGVPDQPDFAPQASQNTVVPALTGEGSVIADWADAGRRPIGVPALLRTPTGVYMSHVWHDGNAPAKRALLKALCASLDGGLRASFAAAERERARAAAEVRAFVKSVPGKKGERRLAWCHSARGLAGRSWDDAVRFLKKHGFTDLIPNLSWADRAYYASDVLPVDPSVATRGDALAECLAACRAHGVKCHVWRVCYNTGGRIDKDRKARFAADGRLVKMFDAKSKSPWGCTFCPSHPENIRLETDAMLELASKGVDGIHYDYIRYADRNFCFCDGCRRRFERACGVAVADWPAAVRSDAALSRKWTDWRCANISRVVRDVAEAVRRKYPRVEISAAVRASVDGAYSGDGQDWTAWAKNGWVDFLCPMNYTPHTVFFRSTCRDQMKALAGTRAKLYPGIGLSCWPADGTEARKMAAHIRALRADGLEGFTVFNFDGRAEEAFPILSTGPTRAK